MTPKAECSAFRSFERSSPSTVRRDRLGTCSWRSYTPSLERAGSRRTTSPSLRWSAPRYEPELPRTPLRRSSQNSSSPLFTELPREPDRKGSSVVCGPSILLALSTQTSRILAAEVVDLACAQATDAQPRVLHRLIRLPEPPQSIYLRAAKMEEYDDLHSFFRAEMPRDPLAPEADSRPDPGTSRRNPRGTQGSRVARSSLRASSASRRPSGNCPPRWYKVRNRTWPCRVCLATERARSPAP